MAILDGENRLTTVIVLLKVKEGQQDAVVELAKEHVGPAMSMPGLVSANFHRSLDGKRVINYGQWEDRDAIYQLTQRPGFGKEDGYWAGLAENEFHLYEVLVSETTST